MNSNNIKRDMKLIKDYVKNNVVNKNNETFISNELLCLEEISNKFQNLRDFREEIPPILKDLNKIIKYDRVIIYRYNSIKNSLRCEINYGLSARDIVQAERSAINEIPGWVIRNRQPCICNEIEETNDQTMQHVESAGSLILAPLLSQNECLGVIELISSQNNIYTQKDLRLLNMFANQMANHLNSMDRKLGATHQFQKIFDRIHIPIFNCSSSGHFIFVNQALTEFIGFKSVNDANKANVFDYVQFSSKSDSTFYQLLQRCGFFKNLEVQIKRMDNKTINARITIFPMKDHNDQLTGYEGIIQDSSEKCQLKVEENNIKNNIVFSKQTNA